jgi:hypothetical protein
MSLVPLYAGEALFEDMFKIVRGLGFELWRISPGFYDYRTGRTLQVNCVFFRHRASSFAKELSSLATKDK